jgi:hypothetical protein
MTRQLPAGKCISHAVASVRNNIAYAFRISSPWYAVMAPVVVILMFISNYLTGGNPESSTGMTLLIDLVRGLVTMLAFASIAVNWHRYILLDEVPHGNEIFRLDDKTCRYFGNLILLFLMLMGVGIVIGLPIGFVIGLARIPEFVAPEFVAIFVALVVAPGAGVLALRWGVKFPAIALGRRDFSMKDAWRVTKENDLPIFLVFLFEIVAVMAAILISGLLAYLASLISTTLSVVIAMIIGLVVNWTFTIFSITILTSLYGFFAEQRDF